MKVSPLSTRKIYELGIESIPSESECYPAKLAHGHIMWLLKEGVKNIFYPCIPYEQNETKDANNHYNCPIVTSYAENIKNNVEELKDSSIRFLRPFLALDNPEVLASRLYDELKDFYGVTKEEVSSALQKAFAEAKAVREDIRRKGEETLAWIAETGNTGIVLCGRPYHIDPEINHGINDLITSYGIPVWVMEPVRGGKLANLNENQTARLREIEPDKSTASWGFRFLQTLPNVKMVLSGMSNMEQMVDNVNTFDSRIALSDAEFKLVLDIAEELKNAVPCTACRYCCDGCPMGLDIPTMMSICSDIRFAPVVNSVMMLQFAPEEKRPSACIACGKCTKVCPQGIDIPAVMKELAERLESIPSWEAICQQRIQEQKDNANK